ncbi:MAG: TlpA family protein disulfide reductase [Chloroflexi bacterium]|nr:TlpA family protein disulfide reductase [Chloroflexota bacterium]
MAIVAFFAFGLKVRGEPQPSSGLAPDFTLITFNEETIRLSQLRGQVVVINFWASWCIPCRAEAPFLEKTFRDYKNRGVVFIGVDWSDPEPDARKYIAEFNLTYYNGPDIGTKIGQLYRIRGVPETFFVGKDGNLYGNALGPITRDSSYMTHAQFIAKLDELLEK